MIASRPFAAARVTETELLPLDPPGRALSLFRRGWNTADIAERLRTSEPEACRLLALGRAADLTAREERR